jgi:hypothetical protein
VGEQPDMSRTVSNVKTRDGTGGADKLEGQFTKGTAAAGKWAESEIQAGGVL